MIAIALSELAAWKQKGAGQSGCMAIFMTGLAWLGSSGQFLFCLFGTLLFLGWLGWHCGFETWSASSAKTWHRDFGKTKISILIGKLAAYLVLALGHLVLLMPLYLQGIRLWGMTTEAALLVMGNLVVSGLCVCSLCLFQLNSTLSWRGIPVAALLGAWFIPSLALPFLQSINPALLLWGIFSGAPAGKSVVGIVLISGLTAIAVMLNSVFLGKHGGYRAYTP